MKTLTKILGMSIMTLGMFAVVGVVAAAPADDLQPASTITYNEELVVNDTGRFDSAYIGKQDEGGVTFFNGTIVNSTTGEDDADNPVTFGDDVRIDGQIYRTEVGGENPIKLADSIRPQTTNTYDLGTSTFQMKDGYFAGTLNAGTLSASNVYTKTEVDALNHIGETWSGSVQGGTYPSILNLANTGDGYGLMVGTYSNYSAIVGGTTGTSAAVNGTNTGSGPGVSGMSNSGYGVYAKSTSNSSLFIDGKIGVQEGSNKAADTDQIDNGATGVSIANSLVTTTSRIFLQIGYGGVTIADNNTEGLRVTNITSGGFDVYVNSGAGADKDIPFAYLVVN